MKKNMTMVRLDIVLSKALIRLAEGKNQLIQYLFQTILYIQDESLLDCLSKVENIY